MWHVPDMMKVNRSGCIEVIVLAGGGAEWKNHVSKSLMKGRKKEKMS